MFRSSSGEFHTFRLPVPSLWPDILQKIKAAGLNAISLYTHWGLVRSIIRIFTPFLIRLRLHRLFIAYP